MKVMRMIAAVGVGAWIARKVVSEQAARRDGPHHLTRATGTRASGAAAASGAFRDDRDVPGVGVLRDEQALRS